MRQQAFDRRREPVEVRARSGAVLLYASTAARRSAGAAGEQMLVGAGGRNRTGTVLPPADFESAASTDFATPASGVGVGYALEGAGLWHPCTSQFALGDNPTMASRKITYPTVEDAIGNTPLVRLVRVPGLANEQRGNVILCKLEGNNPAGSVKDRPAISMIMRAEARGRIKPGDTLIEATSGNTGIALAMAAAIRGYRMILIMPEHLSLERRQAMAAYGAEIILTPREGGMETARDVSERMRDEGKGIILDQFANPDNPLSHYEGTGPEIWRDTDGCITHFVATMGTTGTSMGASQLL